jgi:hypothetical protein
MVVVQPQSKGARAAGMEDVSPETITTAEIILSIVPPGEAVALAEGFVTLLGKPPQASFYRLQCPESENQNTGRCYACTNGVRCDPCSS